MRLFAQSAACSTAPPQQSEAGQDQGRSSRPSSDKFLSLIQSLFRVGPSLGNCFYRTSRRSSHSLGFPYQCCDVCSRLKSTKESIGARFHWHKHCCTLGCSHLVSLLVTDPLPHCPQGIHCCAVLSHAQCSSASEIGAAHPWAQSSSPGQGTASPHSLWDSHPQLSFPPGQGRVLQPHKV